MLGDWCYFAAAAAYVVAMLVHAVDLVIGDRVAVGAARAVVAAAVGGPAPDVTRPVGLRLGRMAAYVTVAGAGLHAASIVLRAIATGRWPLANMYEFTAVITFAMVVTWLVRLRRRPQLSRIGVFVLAPVSVLVFLGGTALHVAAGPVMPALRSPWLAVHVTTVALSSGVLLLAGLASAAVVAARSDRVPRIVGALPPADELDRLAYRLTAVAFPVFTFAIVAGGIWAESAWGRFWGWDPKETVAFISWVVYAAYLHARATAGWRTRGAAWINVAAGATVVVNLFVVNLVVAGLHSYAGY
ncbi:c-type cytochrome biogenesis protein CcsB [Pseudonocardia sp. CA-107938]|uniref:c-type cytochrome biogenesis protein CcsB n=1 Tax=Pseudonocardia sp. CA-107938 TaxID=3240021 RepID=UPI003D8BA67B